MKSFLAWLFAAVAAAGLGISAWGYYTFNAPGPLAAPKTLLFGKGIGFTGIADALESEGVIHSGMLFKAAAVANGQARQFKAGEYAFPAAIAMKDIAAMLAAGKVVIHKITLAEGLSVREVQARLATEPALEGSMPGNIPEGSLLPETYHFIRGDGRAELVGRMRQAMDEALADAWRHREEGLPLFTPQEALTLASIVEKETGVAEERPRVAAVYINRLRLNMLLQADPTVAYGIESANGEPMTRPLTLADLHTPTPYNTYIHPGLPPSPIANPGRESILAVLHPAPTKELYFVATGTGGHRFAETLEEHRRNVAAYRAAVGAH